MLTLSDEHVEMIHAKSREAFPNEACGFLVGVRDDRGHVQVHRVVPCRNNASMPTSRFELDVELHARLQREARHEGFEVLGCYHSHPRGPATPSEEDLSRAIIADWLWLIMGDVEKGQQGVKAYMLKVDANETRHFVPVQMRVDASIIDGAHL